LPITVCIRYLWLGAKKSDTDCDWLKQIKRFTAFCFRWIEIVFCFFSVLCQLCRQLYSTVYAYHCTVSQFCEI